MSDFGDIHEKINEFALAQAETNGMLNAVLPKLATKDEVEIMVIQHKEECRKSRDNHKRPSIAPALWQASYKKWIAICGAVTAIAAAVTALAYAL